MEEPQKLRFSRAVRLNFCNQKEGYFPRLTRKAGDCLVFGFFLPFIKCDD